MVSGQRHRQGPAAMTIRPRNAAVNQLNQWVEDNLLSNVADATASGARGPAAGVNRTDGFCSCRHYGTGAHPTAGLAILWPDASGAARNGQGDGQGTAPRRFAAASTAFARMQ